MGQVAPLVAYPFLPDSAILFLLHVEFGLVMAAQYVWPTSLMNSFPFNLGRATHLNLDFMAVRTQYVGFWMFWVWLFGLVLFLPGVLVYLVDFFALGSTTQSSAVIITAGTALLPVIVIGLLTAWPGMASQQAPRPVRPASVLVPKDIEQDPEERVRGVGGNWC